MSQHRPHLPQLGGALRPGDCVRLVSPASWFETDRLQQGMAALAARGYRPQLGQHALARYGQYTAGTVEERLSDLHAAFADPEVRAILCNRGGYGSAELLPGLDLDLIRRNPKILIGCSDITAIQTWIHDQTGLVVFHGPMAAGDWARPSGVDDRSWQAALSGSEPWELGAQDGLRTLRPGVAQGRFYGGCLSLLVASLGTPYAVQPNDCVLFLEDVGEKPYRIERMLLQLRLAGKLERVRGIVFGQMKDCTQPGASAELLDQVLLRVLADFPGPVATGLRSGHVDARNITLPIGMNCALDCSAEPVVRFLSPSVRTLDAR